MEFGFNLDGIKYRIRQKIDEKGLFAEVHLERGGRGIRNDLDCNGLLTNDKIRSEIAWTMINHIYKGDFGVVPDPKDMEDDSYLLVGVANSGVMIASHMAFITGLPMLYYVPTEKHLLYTEHEIQWEKDIEALKHKKIVLIIGTSVTGNAIRDAKRYIGELFQIGDGIHIDKVLGIINRDKENVIINELRTQGTIVDFLIEGYPADWCNHSIDGACPYDYKCRGHVE